MADTIFETSDALTVKRWASELGYDIVYRTELSPLIDMGVIDMKNELTKGPGDQVTFALGKKLTGAGFTSREVAEGNGESLSLYSDAIVINELGHVVGLPSAERAIDSQRIPFSLREFARNRLKTWWEERLATIFFNHACGNTYANSITDTAKYRGFNTITAPTSGRHLWAAAGASETNTTDEGLESDDIFNLNLVDKAREAAETAASPIHPLNVTGNEAKGGMDISGGRYVMYLHPYQVTDLRITTSTGQWLDIQKAAMQGGNVSKNPIYTDALGEYNNVILKKSTQVTTGTNSSTAAQITTVRRAVLMGQQAVAMAFGKNNGPTTMNWNEELLDHKRKMEVSVFSMLGMKKTVFDSADFGTVVMSTYAAAHT